MSAPPPAPPRKKRSSRSNERILGGRRRTRDNLYALCLREERTRRSYEIIRRENMSPLCSPLVLVIPKVLLSEFYGSLTLEGSGRALVDGVIVKPKCMGRG